MLGELEGRKKERGKEKKNRRKEKKKKKKNQKKKKPKKDSANYNRFLNMNNYCLLLDSCNLLTKASE